ncbi:pyrroline-5-carboxylate reductase [Paraliobacillus ryukyuensis]|uniref:pyrroline-5-carboxylate reductase n=1 Tax=Paraliobacillus ryukyuensis TaxID=200904 RepID=UPI0009A66E95|nr:pyrroline-5-carboxylate reductase [Paraliobacillus ryukyuensis]
MFKKIVFLGAGAMAEALIAGIVKANIVKPEQIVVTNKSNQARLQALASNYQVQTTQSIEQAVTDADAVVFAMKPKDIQTALAEVRPHLTESQVLISVLAGTPITVFHDTLTMNVPIIRTMPNTSSTIGYGATAITVGEHVTEQQLEQTKKLFETVGTVTVVEEDDMHVVTALSGSGPAYFYYMVEAMQEVAAKKGLEATKAKELIYQTILGVAEMLQQTEETPTQLRKNITSPNGVTQRAVEALYDHHLPETIEAAIEAAIKRSKELGKA